MAVERRVARAAAGRVAGRARAALFLHGELRSEPALRTAIIAGAGFVTAVLAFFGAQRWRLWRAVLAERPRSPDEWTADAGARLWAGHLESPEPLSGGALYRRVETERWQDGRWRPVAVREDAAPLLEFRGRRARMVVALPRARLRRGAVEVEPYRADPQGWRVDRDPDPALLYRTRTLAIPAGAPLRVLGRARRGPTGLALEAGAFRSAHFADAALTAMGREATLCAAAALATTLFGLWGAWP